MAEGRKAINGVRGWTTLILTAFGSMLGGGGGLYVFMWQLGPDQLQAAARPDPATGTELRLLREQVMFHLTTHPDQVNLFDRRITQLESAINDMERRITRLERNSQ